MSPVPSVSRGVGRLVTVVLAAVLLLSGCQAVPDDELEGELAAISGVALVDVGSERVKVTLAEDILAADAATAILAVRDAAVASHPLGAQVELVVVLPAGPRDLGGARPWAVYSYAYWSAGAAGDAAFEQQAGFFGSLAEWETLAAGPAQFLHLGFRVVGVSAPDPATDGSGETAPPETATPEDGAAPLPSPQAITVQLFAPDAAENGATDVAAARTELADLWAASGGVPAAVAIS